MTAWGDWRRRRILKRVSFDADVWRAALAAPLYAGLDAMERARLYDLARLFIAEKSFSGAAGFAMDEIHPASHRCTGCSAADESGPGLLCRLEGDHRLSQ